MSTDLGPDSLTAAVTRSFQDTPDQRLREVLESLTQHLHAFVREVRPTIDEWQSGIDFLTAVGQKCDDVRQEFVLLSDVLGVSMMVETLNDSEIPDATDSTVLGPFHMVDSPRRELGDNISPESTGEPCVVSGRVVTTGGEPVPHAEIDVWQANTEGFYDVQQPGVQHVGNGRGLFRADEQGRFSFRSVVPSHYPIPTDGPVGALLTTTGRHPYRPAHVHFIVTAPGYKELTTHIFVAGSPYTDSDAVFAVKESLVKEFATNADPEAARRLGVPSPFREARFDILLSPVQDRATAPGPVESVGSGPRAFQYEALPMRVKFGAGSLETLPDELEKLGLHRVLVLSTPFQQELAEQVSQQLGELSVGVHAGAEMHVPIESARKAREVAAELGADGCVAVGGGSTIGLGKAIALEFGMPIVAIPTTYAGSEMTPVWGLTENGEKRTGRDPRVLPTSVIYDPDLTLTLPAEMSVTSGFNAIAHAAEALYAPDASPIISLMAEEGVRSLVSSLPRIAEDPADGHARAEALYGAWLCGATLGATTMSLHHKVCHALGGTFNLPHAETHTVFLPYALAYNAPAAPSAVEALRRATGEDDPASFLRSQSLALGAPHSLSELGLQEADIDVVVDQVTGKPYANPRDVTPEGIRSVLTAALRGDPVHA